MKWRLNSRSTRTLGDSILKLEHELSSRAYNSKPLRTYRNPIFFAQELAEEMSREGLSQADLARKRGISRARVNQWLSLLQLPEREIRRILAMGDSWERRLLTERGLRMILRSSLSK
ncbi:MAG: hypothetical protein KAT09_07795 [Candidatus Aegiribacteria sp.]|nr:hypothetical protein [Candidatus Aegiribacteria sp.]